MTQDPRENYTNTVEQKPYGVEELQVVGEQLLAKVKEFIHEGNVRRIIIKQDGNSILELPLTIGVAGVILAPALAAVGVLGALLTQCSIEVVRAETPAETVERKVEELRDDVPPSV
jgi:hypothetical protein